jgi:oxygen-independent coproporphyrinogen-3 oxidase
MSAGGAADFPARWLAHMGGRVPRYTSYPTANRFTPQLGQAQMRRWLGQLDPSEPASLYLHVPFCARLCLYCGCNTQAVSASRPTGDFARALIAEIGSVAAALPQRMRASRVHLGGGTPTTLGADGLAAVMAAIHRRFDIIPGAEIAVEIDPRSFDQAMAGALARLGVTRASLGVQDFAPEVQAAVGRVQPFAQVAEAVSALRGAGIEKLSFDLLYGLPLQTVETVVRGVGLAAALKPDRVALFGYAHVPWMKPQQKALEKFGLPGVEERWRMARAAEARLLSLGYAGVGMDHFTLPGDALALAQRVGRLRRNFQGYTEDDAPALLGFGPSAISSLPQGYAQSHAETAAWRGAVERGELATGRGAALTDDDRLRRAAIERLMCDMRVDLDRLALMFDRAPAETFVEERGRLHLLAAEGLVRFDGGLVEMAQEARPLVRAVAAVFDEYLARDEDAARAAPRHAVAV